MEAGSPTTQVALVTGASGGLGSAIARALGARGYRLVLSYHTEDHSCDALLAALDDAGCQALALPADVRSEADVQQMVTEGERALGAIDVLVNAAGCNRDSMFHRSKVADWREVIETNLLGTMITCWCVVRGMRDRGKGRIINLSSVIGLTGNVGQTAYAASKAGVIGFTKALAAEVARYGVTVNAIAPGFIDAGMVHRLSEPIRERIVERTPLGRLGTPQEVAALAAYLASPEAAFINGETIGVTGGWLP